MVVQLRSEDLNDLRDLEGVDKDRNLGFDFVDKIRVQISDKQQEYCKAHKPFCGRCARLDLKDAIDEYTLIKARKREEIKGEEIKKMVDDHIKNLDKYGDPARFTKITEREALHQFPGDKRQTIVGINTDFKCKIKGCGISVLVPNEELEPQRHKAK